MINLKIVLRICPGRLVERPARELVKILVIDKNVQNNVLSGVPVMKASCSADQESVSHREPACLIVLSLL